MRRAIPIKRITALAVAALTIGTACALTVPASAHTPTSTRAASIPAITLDFTSLLGGANATGTGKVLDANNDNVGTVYQHCDALDTAAGHTYCTGLVALTTGAQLTYAAAVPNTTTYPTSYEGVITGGTRGYDGITGEAHFALQSQATTDLNFS